MDDHVIPKSDPQYDAAMRVLDAMHAYFRLRPMSGAVHWIEDTDGRVVVFTRGEYRDRIMAAVSEGFGPGPIKQYFELEGDGEDEGEDK